ncbi:MAG: segregation/condensation protein A [Oscillospiraceae bacterium]|jgi:segregation and condensation protein A|nr:segregation/condensation protein A [Oscillospiraceae bacterium]
MEEQSTKLLYKLEAFEGPLDLLLNLISKHKLDIYDIPIAELLQQYMAQIKLMQQSNLDVQSEFFEMAARLVHIKTIMLLPKHEEAEEMKKELTGQLLEYQACKQVAAQMSQMVSFNQFYREPSEIELDHSYKLSHDVDVIYAAYLNAVGRGIRRLPPPARAFSGIVTRQIVPVSVKIVYVLRKLYRSSYVPLDELFDGAGSRSELIATFLAVLELVKSKRVAVNEQGTALEATNEVRDRWKSKRA